MRIHIALHPDHGPAIRNRLPETTFLLRPAALDCASTPELVDVAA